MAVAEAIGRKNNAAAPASMAGVIPLTMVNREDCKRVCSIRGKEDLRRFLANLGFVENAEVRMITELSGNLIVAVKGTRIAVSRAMATRILVR